MQIVGTNRKQVESVFDQLENTPNVRRSKLKDKTKTIEIPPNGGISFQPLAKLRAIM